MFIFCGLVRLLVKWSCVSSPIEKHDGQRPTIVAPIASLRSLYIFSQDMRNCHRHLLSEVDLVLLASCPMRSSIFARRELSVKICLCTLAFFKRPVVHGSTVQIDREVLVRCPWRRYIHFTWLDFLQGRIFHRYPFVASACFRPT